MKILLTTLHSKYIHSSLALQYLYSYCKDMLNQLYIQEYTINHDMDYVLGEIYKGGFDIVCFSCYIWNVEHTLQIAKNLKKINPRLTIVLGGPEVSFDSVSVMENHSFVDYIVVGEGEVTFRELMKYLALQEGGLSEIQGIVYRQEDRVRQNIDRGLIQDLQIIPSPFLAGLEGYENKIVYYETSRGCPHNCKYCLSSTIKGVRFFPMERIKKELDVFLANKVKQVKFVDRTFNVKKSHCLDIMRYIHQQDNQYTNFHFEITADLLDDEILDFLSQVREGLFQFEVGVQTTYDKTMEAIDRNVDFTILSEVVKKISSFKNIHLHLDLIAGLPHEDFDRFQQSFDEVYRLKPEKLQLGFLKLLKGSPIRREEELHGYIYKDEPPYEVLANRYLDYGELLKLKMMEEMVETYSNSHGFDYALQFVLDRYYDQPSKLFLDLASYWEEKGHHHSSHGRNHLYEILLNFYIERRFLQVEVFAEVLKFDYLKQGKGAVPSFLPHREDDGFKNKIHGFLQQEQNISQYLPCFTAMAAKNIIKKVQFEIFDYDILEVVKSKARGDIKKEEIVILFDYEIENKVFEKARYHKIEL